MGEWTTVRTDNESAGIVANLEWPRELELLWEYEPFYSPIGNDERSQKG